MPDRVNGNFFKECDRFFLLTSLIFTQFNYEIEIKRDFLKIINLYAQVSDSTAKLRHCFYVDFSNKICAPVGDDIRFFVNFSVIRSPLNDLYKGYSNMGCQVFLEKGYKINYILAKHTQTRKVLLLKSDATLKVK